MTIKQVVRQLRKNQTNSENILWQSIRSRKINNRKFIRQYPISFEYDNLKRLFILDFYCSELKLGIEVDGAIHDHQQEYDRLREHIIKILGINIIRFTNDQVENNLDQVIEKIENLTTLKDK